MGLTLPLNTYAISQEEGQGVHYNFIQQVERQTTVPDGYVGIYTPDDLNNIRNGMTDHYILMNDIDLAVFENWEPIGNSTANTFKGIFDGNGYAVRNMKIDIKKTSDNNDLFVGLFGKNENGSIKNLGMEDSQVSVSSTQLYGDIFVGSIVGNGTQLDNCYNSGDITVYSNYTYAYVGGICGSSTRIYNCYNMGKINMLNLNDYIYAGGIAGSSWYIELCYNTGTITTEGFNADAEQIGGISGSSKQINNCYNSGDIDVDGTTFIFVGGLIGRSNTIMTSYNSGKINVTLPKLEDYYYNVGGLAGYTAFNEQMPMPATNYSRKILQPQYDAFLIDSYYINGVDGPVGNEEIKEEAIFNVKSLTDLQMKSQTSFEGFDFNNIWMISAEGSYPSFRQNPQNPEKEKINKEYVLIHREKSSITENVEIIKWATTNKRVAIINADGELQATGRGEAYVSIVTSDGQVSNCYVTVNYLWWQWLIKVLLFGWIWY